MLRSSSVLMIFLPTILVGDPQPDKVFDKTSINVQVNRVGDLKASIPGNTSYTWIFPPDQEGIDFRSSGLNGFVFPRKVGSYWVGLAYGNPIQVAWIMIKVGDVIPDPAIPNPNPPVAPPPLPQAGVGSYWIVVVVSPLKATPPELNQMFQYAPLVDEILNKGHAWKIIDSNGKDDRGNAVPEVAGAVAAVKNKGLPWVFIVDQDPRNFTIRQSSALPTKPAEMLNLLTKK